MKKVVSLLSISTALLLMYAGAAQAIVTQYDDVSYGGNGRQAWAAAMSLSNQYPNNVNFGNPPGGIVHTGTLISESTVNVGVASTQTDPLFGISIPALNQWYDQVGRDSSGTVLTKTTFTFGAPMYATGGWWDLSPLDYGQGLLFTIIYGDGTRAVAGSIVPQDNGNDTFGPVEPGFWGWISTDNLGNQLPFVALEITSADYSLNRVLETYFLMDLSSAQAVPEPSTFILLGAGLGGLIIWRRRK